MKKCVKVRNVVIGEGIPKICVPLVGSDDAALREELNGIRTLCYDVVEWRMDYHKQAESIEKMQQTLEMIRTTLGDKPLLATFRSKKEGGEKEVGTAYYMALNKAIIATKLADLIDVELFTGDEAVKELMEYAHANGVKVIMSNHDFDQTPAKEEIIERLCRMQEMGADLPKIAVMPKSTEDVLVLLGATNEMTEKYADRPIITMSMAGLGIVSRLSGEIFGSAMTFGAAKMASAPGQVTAGKLAEILQLIHENK